MFSSEHWQIKLIYASFGALLLFIGMLLSPVTAQRRRCGVRRSVPPGAVA